MERDADKAKETDEASGDDMPELSFEDEVRHSLDALQYEVRTATRISRQTRERTKATFSLCLTFFVLWYVCEMIDTWKEDKK
jgi:hypothetical protein